MTSGEEDASNTPKVGPPVLEHFPRGGVEDCVGGGHGADKGHDNIAMAGMRHCAPARHEDVFGA